MSKWPTLKAVARAKGETVSELIRPAIDRHIAWLQADKVFPNMPQGAHWWTELRRAGLSGAKREPRDRRHNSPARRSVRKPASWGCSAWKRLALAIQGPGRRRLLLEGRQRGERGQDRDRSWSPPTSSDIQAPHLRAEAASPGGQSLRDRVCARKDGVKSKQVTPSNKQLWLVAHGSKGVI